MDKLAAGIDNVDGVATLKGLEGIVVNLISVVIGISGMLLFVMLTAGGFRFLTSAGNPESVGGAKKTLTTAIFGLGVVAAALFFLWLIKEITGVDVFIFRVGLEG